MPISQLEESGDANSDVLSTERCLVCVSRLKDLKSKSKNELDMLLQFWSVITLGSSLSSDIWMENVNLNTYRNNKCFFFTMNEATSLIGYSLVLLLFIFKVPGFFFFTLKAKGGLYNAWLVAISCVVHSACQKPGSTLRHPLLRGGGTVLGSFSEGAEAVMWGAYSPLIPERLMLGSRVVPLERWGVEGSAVMI